MNVSFWKMHGAGNDFILVDDRDESFPAHDRDWMERIASRRFGVGCEGIILIQRSKDHDFRMRFFNPDGGEAEMCGNGARCVARLAHDIRVAPSDMVFDTVAGPIQASVNDDQVLLKMTDPKDMQLNQQLEIDDDILAYHFADTGVPHVVHFVEDVDAVDVCGLGAAIRYHDRFTPAGTNANFVQVTGTHAVRVRTYERGVEEETLACGTGIVASALFAGLTGQCQAPVEVTPRSGDVIRVNYAMNDGTPVNVTMLGPAVHVYQGTLSAPV